MRLLRREAELAFAIAFGDAARLVYGRIRKDLTVEERRLFKLLYFPSRVLGGRVAVLEPVAWTFATEMDEETLELLFGVFVLKSRQKVAHEQLQSRWQAFLHFYPYWQEIVRADELESIRKAVAQASRLCHLA